MNLDPLVLAIDVGTSSCRAIVFDAHGMAVPGLRHQVEIRMRTSPPGASECDAEAIVDAVAECLDRIWSRSGKQSSRIAAVGTCTFWHSMVGIDGNGKPTTPLITWADTRSSGAATQLARELDAGSVHARTGCALHSSYFPARLRWLREAMPEQFARTRQWVSPGEYLRSRLTGASGCSVSMASATGLFDQSRLAWAPEMLEAAGIGAESLGSIVDIDQGTVGLAQEFSGRWPGLQKALWAPAIGDGAAGNLGSGCEDGTRFALNLGTSGAVRVLFRSDVFTIPPDLWCYRLDRHRPIMGAAFSDGGNLYAWMRSNLALPADDAEIESSLASRVPFAHRIDLLPFFAGERSTGWRPDAKGAVHGLTLGASPLDLLQAAMEAVALRFSLAVQVLRREFPAAKLVVASGGALSASKAWARMTADAIQMPLLVTDEAEASSRGAAVVALSLLGIASTEIADPIGTMLEPDLRRAGLYHDALLRQNSLYRKIYGG